MRVPSGRLAAARAARRLATSPSVSRLPACPRRYGRPGRAMLRALLSRGWVLQARTLPFYVIRVFQTIVVGFVIGTL